MWRVVKSPLRWMEKNTGRIIEFTGMGVSECGKRIEELGQDILNKLEANGSIKRHTEETPIVETPIVETPIVETPIVETPIVETPIVETPIVETPIVETLKPNKRGRSSQQSKNQNTHKKDF